MVRRLRLKAQAIDDVSEAYDWYESQKDGLGTSFLDELEKYLDTITKRPESFKHHGHQRVAVMSRFPFNIVFGIEFSTILVYRVFHQSRNPGQLAKH
ncbi:MAG: type II toxin-antitoxin system RelE/ParE family toxin [Bacteroidota bacterium]